MDLQGKSDWTWTDDYQTGWAPTNDPRVVCVIKRADEYGGGHIDGDAYAPAFYFERGNITDAGSTFMDDASRHIAERYQTARTYFVNRHYAKGGAQMRYDRVAERYLAIFWETSLTYVSSSIEQGYAVHIFNTPTFRAHVGWEGDWKSIDVNKEDWQSALDGDVFGVGYAVYEERVTDEEPVDIEDGNWNISIEVHGYLGEDYAKESAEAFEAGEPELPEMLAIA